MSRNYEEKWLQKIMSENYFLLRDPNLVNRRKRFIFNQFYWLRCVCLEGLEEGVDGDHEFEMILDPSEILSTGVIIFFECVDMCIQTWQSISFIQEGKKAFFT